MQLEIRYLSKQYDEILALRDFSITFEEGVHGILGPNGAGKSTLFNLLTDNLKRTSGEILFNGECILTMGGRFRGKIGYMPQQQGFYEHFSARAFLLYIASLKGISRKTAEKETDILLQQLHLDQVAHKRLGGFSGGMRQRVLLAQALLGSPDVLLLDEPTAGLDPKERIHFRNLISSLSKDKIVLFATHIVSDIECIADKVLLLQNGMLIKTGTSTELIDSIYGKVGEKTCSKEELHALQQRHRIHNISQKREGLTFRMIGDIIPSDFIVIKNDIGLEDVYLYYLES
jgi:ABC-type multidrug transport system ATPase subunit